MLQQLARTVTALLGILVLGSVATYAQSGQITGHVTDPQGASITDASVQVVNQDKDFKREATTNSQGAYSAPFLPAG